jgi:hypothetical protein
MPPQSTPNRYQLPLISMVGALLVVLALVAVDRVWQALNHNGDGVAVPTVDYSGWVRSAKQDGRLHVLVPSTVPSGWRATSASYDSGALPVWHLGMLVDEKAYVGLDESLMPMDDMVAKYLSAGAERGADVTVRGVVWHSWTDSRGDYALTRSFPAPKGRFPENVLVGGSAEPAQVREYVASLR